MGKEEDNQVKEKKIQLANQYKEVKEEEDIIISRDLKNLTFNVMYVKILVTIDQNVHIKMLITKKNKLIVKKEGIKEEETILLAYNKNGADQESIWYFNTGASNLICGRKKLFVELDESYKDNFIFGDSTKRSIEGKSKIFIKLKNEAQDIISDVYYISDMKSDILSLG